VKIVKNSNTKYARQEFIRAGCPKKPSKANPKAALPRRTPKRWRGYATDLNREASWSAARQPAFHPAHGLFATQAG
jgi:hypothetical protein